CASYTFAGFPGAEFGSSSPRLASPPGLSAVQRQLDRFNLHVQDWAVWVVWWINARSSKSHRRAHSPRAFRFAAALRMARILERESLSAHAPVDAAGGFFAPSEH